MKHDEDMLNGMMGRLKMNVHMKRLRMYISEYSQLAQMVGKSGTVWAIVFILQMLIIVISVSLVFEGVVC